MKKIFLHDNSIEDIATLANLKSLHYLYMDTNKIRDLRPLQNLLELSILYIRKNPLDAPGVDNNAIIDALERNGVTVYK